MATVNPYLTDQILARHDENQARPPRHYHQQAIVDILRASLRGIDERELGEILMHAGTAAASLSKALEESGVDPAAVGPLLAVTLVGAGAALYRGGA